MVDARTKDGGSRRFFPTKTDAEVFASQCRIRRNNEGTAAFGNEDLARYGKTVQDAISFYLAHLRQQEKSLPLSDAIAELVALKRGAGKSVRYTHDLGLRLGRLAKDHGSKSVALFDSKTLDAWLAGLAVAPGTRNTFRRDLRTLFSFCVKRGYTASNPAKETEAVKLPDTPPGILTTTEAARLLCASGDDVRAYVAISLFAGLRSAELEKLDWQNVNLESGLIEVTAATAKTKRRRLVKIEPNLSAWLAPLAQPAGPVAPTSSLRDRLDEVRRRAGFGTPGTETAGEKKAKLKLKAWPQNAGRHSFGSYWLAKYQDAAALALQMGNSQAMVFGHYRELVQPKDAACYWEIKPVAASERKVVAMAS
jgi:integrase